jgi:dTMP kinase
VRGDNYGFSRDSFSLKNNNHTSMAFIVFEGLDACGKSTLMSKVIEHLQGAGLPLQVLRDPGSTELGEKIRQLILTTQGEAPVAKTETLLYQAARRQMVETKVIPALKNKQWVLCDRFYSSTIAFQSSARGIRREEIDQLNRFVVEEHEPDLFVLLDISVAESQKRKSHRAQHTGAPMDRLELEAERFQEKVRQSYLDQAQQNPSRWLVLDGTLSPEALCQATINELRGRQWLL